MAATVSAVIAAYNSQDYLRDAVESVRAQTYPPVELVIVDDGSTDGTWRLIEELAADWPMVRPIRIPHGGTPVAKNRAVFAARGDYVAILDADDLWAPSKLRRSMEFLAAHPELSIVYSPMTTVRMDGAALTGHDKPSHAGRLTAKLFESIFVHDPAVVFHRRVLEACGGFDENIPVGSGHEFWLRVSTKFEFGLIDEPLAIRRWHAESLTRTNRAAGRADKARMLERFYFERGGKELVPRRRAYRRLSRVYCGAGRILLRQGDPRGARPLLAKALRYGPANLKALACYAACRVAGVFSAGRSA